ncbi:MAG: strawberry notch family protein [Hyphomicrobiales bacterium]|nr:strawberry notch family protein [Hyphomicrobiales bacterium]
MTPLDSHEIARHIAAIQSGNALVLPEDERLAVFQAGLKAMTNFVSPLLDAGAMAFRNGLTLADRCSIETPGLAAAWWIAGRAVFPKPNENIVTDAVQPKDFAAALGCAIETGAQATSAIVSSPQALAGVTAAEDCRIALIRDPGTPQANNLLGLPLVATIAVGRFYAIDIYQAGLEAVGTIEIDLKTPATIAALDVLPRRSGTIAKAPPKAPVVHDPILYTRKPADNRLTVSAIYDAYRPRLAVSELALSHPSRLIVPKTLDSIEPPLYTAKPRLNPELLRKGALSDAQFEAVVAMMSAHEKIMPTGARYGVILADGTGVGKTNEEIALYIANKAEGRGRAVYFTEKARHRDNVEKALLMLGGQRSDITDLTAYRADDTLPARNSLLFGTYHTLGEGDTSDFFPRVEQLVEHLGIDFEGLIIFDEAHNLRNAIGEDGYFGAALPSRQGYAGLLLQEKLPRARVVYASATGVSNYNNLAYMPRLGLWGANCPYPTRKDCLDTVEQMGLTGLEVISAHLVASGLMISRTLSLEGVTATSLIHTLNADERRAWDETMKIVLEVREALQQSWKAALPPDKAIPKEMYSHFEAAARRISEMMLVSLKTPTMIDDMKQALIDGKAPVVQLMNTYEADSSSADATAARNLRRLIEEFIPTVRMQHIKGSPVRYMNSYKPVRDSSGAIVPLPGNEALKASLLARLDDIPEHAAPLDQIFAAFGDDTVAEITGRSQRTVTNPKTGATTLQKRTEADVRSDLAAFMGARKQILVFSVGAGGASMDYHAAHDARNQKIRRHYVLQPGQRADQAVQGIGRTHRSNQRQAPEVVLVSTDLPAERAYLSQTLARIRRLGASGQGHRDASTGPYAMRHSYESSYARMAFVRFLQGLVGDKYPDVMRSEFEHITAFALLGPDKKPAYTADDTTIRRIMKRIARTPIPFQTRVFGHVDRELEIAIENSLVDRTYDAGPEPIEQQLKIESEEVIHKDLTTGAEVRAFKVSGAKPPEMKDFDSALAEAEIYNTDPQPPTVWWSPVTNQIWIQIVAERAKTLIAEPTRLRLIEPNRSTIVDYHSTLIYTAERIPTHKGEDQARSIWQERMIKITDMMSRPTVILSGALPTIQEAIDKHARHHAVVADTTDGRRIMGLMLTADEGDTIIAAVKSDARYNPTTGRIDMTSILESIEKNKALVLSNNWQICNQAVLAETRAEVFPALRDGRSAAQIAREIGLNQVTLPGSSEPRYFLPKDKDKRIRALAILTSRFPITTTADVPDWNLLAA